MPVRFGVKPRNELTLVEFEIEGGVLDVKELRDVVDKAPDIAGNTVVCLSGRGPVWLFGALAHKYHYTKAVATYEPRMNACIVISSHDPRYRVGDILPL
jgi:CRISPR-associated protein Csx3